LVNFSLSFTHGQQSLPAVTVSSFNEKIIVSWLNDYAKTVTNIFIQRSFDSLKNFTTIGSVLVPQNKENGYPDNNPPYLRMYYRVSVTFEGGEYEIGPSFRAPKHKKELNPISITDLNTKIITKELFWQPLDIREIEKIEKNDSISIPSLKKKETMNVLVPAVIKPTTKLPPNIVHEKDSIAFEKPKPAIEKPVLTSYPSNYLYINKQNSLTIHLPDAHLKNYQIKFYDESNAFLFELDKLTDDYLIIEKFNFTHAGWFNFELLENGNLIEKNKFYISKDQKQPNK